MPVFAQPVIGHFVSFGVTGGVGLTDAFSDETVAGLNANIHYFSGSKDYIVGPAIEVHLPLRLSVEFDALYRPLNLTRAAFITVAPSSTTRTAIVSWECPLLAKYRLPAHLVSPFVEAGPSFRSVTNQSLSGIQLSGEGFTAGVGVEAKLGPIKIGPEVRYTRWGGDSNPAMSSLQAQSNVNQVELLLGLKF
jgi:opacity protein-like surface antigen